jgi:dethiobiotin synthetase
MTQRKYFITGTDTDVGKTYVTCQLLEKLNKAGHRTAGFKLLASGCEKTINGLRNDDALKLQVASSVDLPYEMINPIAFEPPIAPHIAAEKVSEPLTVDRLATLYQERLFVQADYLIFEGVGGWFVPLNKKETMADFVRETDLEVILVVKMRLGCLNHALLTLQAIKLSGLKIAGWVPNFIPPRMKMADENLKTLRKWLGDPTVL